MPALCCLFCPSPFFLNFHSLANDQSYLEIKIDTCMGCYVSRLDANNGATLPSRLRFIHQRPATINGPTLSKKELLPQKNNNVDDININDHSSTTYYSPVMKDHVKEEEKVESPRTNITDEDGFVSADDGDDDDDANDDRRMIGHEDEGSFPGSPSFRVYFKDDKMINHDDDHIIDDKNNDALRETPSSTNETVQSNVVKKAKKKRSFRKVLLPKNLFHVKSCYTPSSSSHGRHHDDSSSHYQAHLLTPKKSA